MMLAYIGPSIVLLAVLGLALALLPIWFLWRIVDRVGLVGPMALLCFIPGGLAIVLGVVAFSEWPNLPPSTRVIPPQWKPGD
jgi:hypothetical protein